MARLNGYDSVRVDIRGLAAFEGQLREMPERFEKAARLALNSVGRSMRTHAWREIRDEINLKPSFIRNEINFIPATPGELRVVLWARRRGALLSNFPHAQLWRPGKTVARKKSGVRVDVGRGWNDFNKGAFIVPGGQAKGLIAEPVKPARYYTRKGETKKVLFEVMYGPSVSQLLDSRLEEFAEIAEQKLESEVRRQLSRDNL